MSFAGNVTFLALLEGELKTANGGVSVGEVLKRKNFDWDGVYVLLESAKLRLLNECKDFSLQQIYGFKNSTNLHELNAFSSSSATKRG